MRIRVEEVVKFIVALIIALSVCKLAHAGLVDMMQREGQTNQLELDNKLMIENNKLLEEILSELIKINKNSNNI
jgi:hypothetical protein